MFNADNLGLGVSLEDIKKYNNPIYSEGISRYKKLYCYGKRPPKITKQSLMIASKLEEKGFSVLPIIIPNYSYRNQYFKGLGTPCSHLLDFQGYPIFNIIHPLKNYKKNIIIKDTRGDYSPSVIKGVFIDTLRKEKEDYVI